jgi:DNA-binding LacI/PurR family transcriptional regulator
LSAIGVLNAADELRLEVPADLSVVGYDNTVYSRLPRLSITTVDGHNAEVGQLARRTLVARIGRDASSAASRSISSSAVVRSKGATSAKMPPWK